MRKDFTIADNCLFELGGCSFKSLLITLLLTLVVVVLTNHNLDILATWYLLGKLVTNFCHSALASSKRHKCWKAIGLPNPLEQHLLVKFRLLTA